MLYTVKFFHENDIDLMDTVIFLYTRTVLKQELSAKQRHVLREYINNGYNINTKRAIRVNLNMTEYNLNTVNHTLQKKGLLLPHPTNQRLKLINPDLEKLQKCFLDNPGQKNFLINFLKNE